MSTPIRRHAHESGDGIQICHCPFCGSGQVIGRSDGNTECQFCNQAFLVRVQPLYSAFPQQVGGVPVQIPGMPPAGSPPMSGGMPPGQEGDASADPDADPNATGAPGGDGVGKPPFANDGSDGGASGSPAGDDKKADPVKDKDDNSGGGKPPFGKKSSSLRYRTADGRMVEPTVYLRYLAQGL